MRWTILLGKSQRNEKINLVIMRSLQVNPAIGMHQVFQPCHQEKSSHQEEQMPTLQSRRIDVMSCKITKIKKRRRKKESIKWKVWSNLIIKKKNEKNLTIRKFSKQKKKVQTLPSGRTYRILVLVKGNRQMGSQVSPTTQILLLVKGDRRRGSKVSPTTYRHWLWLKRIARWDLRLA